MVPAEALPTAGLEGLRQALLEAPTRESKFGAAEAWLEHRYAEAMVPPARIGDMISRLAAEPGARHAEVVGAYPLTQKHLITEFKRYLGVTPKYYHRILRFNDVLRHVQTEGGASWAAVAHHCGYSDQSHFIRDFRHFSGFNPTEYLRQDFEDGQTNFFPIDRQG